MLVGQKQSFMTNRRAVVLLLVGVMVLCFGARAEASSVVCDVIYTTPADDSREFRRVVKHFGGVQDRGELFALCSDYAYHYLSNYPYHQVHTIKIELL